MQRILILVLISFSCLQAMGQHFGVKGGATFANFRGEDAKDFERKIGFAFGLLYQHHFTQKVGLQTELLYTSKGAINKYKSGNNFIDNRYRLHYIEIPVMLHLSSGRIFADLGPQVSFLTKAWQLTQTEPDNGNSTTTVKENITDNPYAIDYSLVGGIGYRAVNKIGIEARYAHGFKRIDDEGNALGADRYNSTIYLMVSYLFM